MMYVLEMAGAFLALAGVALLLRRILGTNTGEGFFLAVGAVALTLWAGNALTGSFRAGLYGLCAAALVGWVLTAADGVRKKTPLCVLVSPAAALLAGLFAFGIFTLWHDFIQHVDEFHYWAAAVKYMLEKDAMPTGSDFLGGGGGYAFATSLFHLFFQKFTGYNEQTMYVSSFLLMWIGFLLPFSEYEWKDWKKPLLFAGIVYFALYSLYLYGGKSLYVDVPTAAFAGGLAGWWANRRKKRANALIALTGFLLLHFFKPSAGLLMAVLAGLFMLTHTWMLERSSVREPGKLRRFTVLTAVLCAAVVLGSGVLLLAADRLEEYETVEEAADAESVESAADNMESAAESVESAAENVESAADDIGTEGSAAEGAAASAADGSPDSGAEAGGTEETVVRWRLAGVWLPERVSELLSEVQLSHTKITKTLGAFFTKSFGASLSTRSSLALPFVPFLLFLLLLFYICGDLYGERGKYQVYILYSVFAALCYLAALFFAYLFLFAYELSVNLRSCQRYFSIFAIYLFALALSELLRREKPAREGVRRYLTLGIGAFFLLGLNEKFLPNTTALDKESVSGYAKISGVRTAVQRLEELLGDTDRVYYLCQYSADDLSGAELYNAPALYYLDGQISNYLKDPWKFKEDGSNVRLEEDDTQIDALPELLADGGYTYLWVHTSDSWLKENLKSLFGCSVKSGGLYRIVYEDGAAVGLEYVEKLN